VTIGVAVYLYRSFKEFKSLNGVETTELPVEEGETEFEIGDARTKGAEREILVQRHSDDDVLFDEEEEIGR